jgi:branched-chain amino acid aminotransferase
MTSILDDLRIQRAATSRRSEVDPSRLGFGDHFSDHMFSLRYRDGAWGHPEIVPLAPIPLHPGCLALHYGQSVFEGLKAFRGVDDKVRVFRPDRNAARFRESCLRLCIPALPDGVFEAAVEEIVRVEHEWIPTGRGEALYVRPLVFAEDGHLQVRPSSTFRLLVFTSPVTNYYNREAGAVALKAQSRYTRAAPGGVGFAKTGGNYAAALFPATESIAEGFDQSLWLDGAEHRYVEEVGQMNIFFDFEGRVATPDLRGTILPGITRESVIALLRDRGIEVEERRIAIDEVIRRSKDGTLREAFGAGTAAVITPIGRIGFEGKMHEINGGASGPLGAELYDALIGIQLGEREDCHGWNRIVDLDAAPAQAAD